MESSLLLFGHQVVSDSSWPHGLQHTRLPWPSPSPGVWPSSCPLNWWCHPHISFCHPLLLSIFPSIRVFSNKSAVHIRRSKYCNFSFVISSSGEYSGLISFRMDWLALLTVQGTLKSLLQHHSSKALLLQRSAFFIVQLLHPYVTTGNTVALTRWTFAGQVMSLLFEHTVCVCHSFPAKRQSSDFLAAVTIHSDWAQEEETRRYLPLVPFYLPWSHRPDTTISVKSSSLSFSWQGEKYCLCRSSKIPSQPQRSFPIYCLIIL